MALGPKYFVKPATDSITLQNSSHHSRQSSRSSYHCERAQLHHYIPSIHQCSNNKDPNNSIFYPGTHQVTASLHVWADLPDPTTSVSQSSAHNECDAKARGLSVLLVRSLVTPGSHVTVVFHLCGHSNTSTKICISIRICSASPMCSLAPWLLRLTCHHVPSDSMGLSIFRVDSLVHDCSFRFTLEGPSRLLGHSLARAVAYPLIASACGFDRFFTSIV